MKRHITICILLYSIFTVNLVESQTLAGGNYYIGGSAGIPAGGCTYINIGQAFNDINSKTILGAINLIITADYSSTQDSFPLILNSNPGSNATNSITLKPDNGVNASITGTSISSILMLNGADYFILDGSNNGSSSQNLIVKNLAASGYISAIWLASTGITDGATHNVIRNCKISTATLNNPTSYIIAICGATMTSSGTNNDNITISNNEITNGSIGIAEMGVLANTSDSINIIHNIIDTLSFMGITTSYTNAITISENTIRNVTSINQPAYGIQLYYSNKNAVISNNRIYNINCNSPASTGEKGIWLFYTGSSANIKIFNNVIYNIYGAAFNTAGPNMIAGIGIYGSGSHIYIYYNSVNLYGSMTCNCNSGNQPFISAALFLDASSSAYLYVKNNVLVNGINNYHTGQHLPLTAYSIYDGRTVQITNSLNNNDYYAYGPYGVLGYFKTNITTLSTWKTNTLQDANSIATDPYFNSDTQLEPSLNSPLLTAGAPISGFSTDILNVTRNATTPTIGAFENIIDVTGPTISYTPVPRSPSTSDRTLIAKITDISGVPVSGPSLPRLFWKINASGLYYAISGTPIGNNNYSFTFGLGVVPGDTVFFYIVAQDSFSIPRTSCYPSTGAAGFSIDPPAVSIPPTYPDYYRILPELAGGDYYIGGSGSSVAAGCSFVDITQAFNVLNNISLTGAVNLILTSYYNSVEDTFPAILNEVYNANATNTITLKPDTGVKVYMKGFAAPSIIKLNGTDYFTIDGSNNGSNSIDMTIRNCFYNDDIATIFISSPDTSNGAHHNTIKNCNILLDSITYHNNYVIAIGGEHFRDSGYANNNITIKNNKISSSLWGIFQWGSGIKLTDSLIIEGNTFDSLYTGMILTYTKSAKIANNIIKNIISPLFSPSGIIISNTSTNAQISGNKIFNIKYIGQQNYGAKGISISGTGVEANISVYNNSISDISGNGTGNGSYKTSGIYLSGKNENMNIFFNTVNLFGILTCVGGVYPHDCSALTISFESKYLSIRNNIFVNGQYITNYPSSSYAIYNEAPVSAFNIINTNDYFAFGAQGILGRSSITDYSNLSGWQKVTNQDSASVSGNPIFQSVTDLHPTTGIVNNTGTPVIGITVDINNYIRNPITPDIGAYEFSLPPIVITQSDSNLTSKSVRLYGTACAQNEPNTSLKFDIGTTLSYGTLINAIPQKISNNDSIIVFADVSGLNPKTTYHYRLVGTNALFTSYGFDSIFTTPASDVLVKTEAASSVTTKTATLNGTVNPNSELTNVGFEWGTSVSYENSIIATPNPISGDVDIKVFSALNGLIPNTLYHYRIKVTNSKGTQYGFDMTFTTNDTLPSVTTDAISNLTYNGAISGGNVIDNGGSQITDRGVCWGISSNPTIALPAKTSDGPGTGAFVSSVSNLNPLTLYYLRAYAINNLGPAYGNEISFTTLNNSVYDDKMGNFIKIYTESKYIYVTVQSKITPVQGKIILSDLNGKVLKSINITEGVNIIDMSEAVFGLYYLSVASNSGIYTKKVVIQ